MSLKKIEKEINSINFDAYMNSDDDTKFVFLETDTKKWTGIIFRY